MATLHQADARKIPLPDELVHAVVTSPPYWGMRNYAIDNGIGLEQTMTEWVQNIMTAFREVWRVLRTDGTCWLNLGDTYSEKNALAQPWRIAIALQQPWLACRDCGTIYHQSAAGNWPDGRLICPSCLKAPGEKTVQPGWILRKPVIWAKNNPMPSREKDRPTTAHEPIFMLIKTPDYYYDDQAVREPATGNSHARRKDGRRDPAKGADPNDHRPGSFGDNYVSATAALRDVWNLNVTRYWGEHHATFPEDLPVKPILASTSAHGVCKTCGAPWERQTKDTFTTGKEGRRWKTTHTTGWASTCQCNEPETVPATVLDPFVGSGTTCVTAQTLGRSSVGLDLNPEYLKQAAERLATIPRPMHLGI